jgi:hypothetical protein
MASDRVRLRRILGFVKTLGMGDTIEAPSGVKLIRRC